MNKQALETLLTEKEVARITSLSIASVRRWRLRGEGPPFVRINSSIRYQPSDVASWIASRPRGGTREVKE